MAPKTDNPFFFEADLDTTNLSKALSKAERSYLGMAKGMGKLTESLGDMDSQKAVATKNQIKKLKGAAKDTRSEQTKHKVIKKAWRSERTIFMAREKLQRKQKRLQRKVERGGIIRRAAGGIGSKVGAAVGGAISIGLIGNAVKGYLAFDRQVRSLNTTLSGTPHLIGTAASAVQGLTGYLDLSRDELVQMTKSLNVVALEIGNLPNSKEVFKDIAMDTIHLSKSMDVAAQSVSDLYSTFLRVYHLPHQSLRGISASMKFIQEQTGMSGEELMTFGKGLRNVLAQMVGATGKTKAQATKDLMAMSGVFKTAGVDATQMTDIFAKAMNRNSEEGRKFLQFTSEGTGKSIDEVRAMLQRGEFLDVAGMMSARLRKAGPKALQEYQDYYSQLSGLGLADMLALSKLTTKNFKDLAAKSDLAAKKGDLHRKRAMRLQSSLTRMWNTMKRAFEKLWLSVGKTLTVLVAKIAKFMIPRIATAVQWLNDRFSDFTKKGGGEFTRWAESTWAWLKNSLWPVLKDIGSAMGWVAGQVKSAITWFSKLSGTEKQFAAWAAGIGIALIALTGPGAALAVLVAAVVGAKKALDELFEANNRMLGERKKWQQQEQNQAERESMRKQFEDTLREVSIMKRDRSVAKLASYIKQGLITPDGKIGPTALKLFRPGQEVGDKAHAQKILSKTFADLNASVKIGTSESGLTSGRLLSLATANAAGGAKAPERAGAPATRPAVVKTAPGTVPTPQVAAPPQPIINIKSDSKTRNMLLESIRQQLEAMQRSNSISRAGAGGVAAASALG